MDILTGKKILNHSRWWIATGNPKIAKMFIEKFKVLAGKFKAFTGNFMSSSKTTQKIQRNHRKLHEFTGKIIGFSKELSNNLKVSRKKLEMKSRTRLKKETLTKQSCIKTNPQAHSPILLFGKEV